LVVTRPLLTYRGVEQHLGVSASTIKRLVRMGELEPVRLRGAVRFAVEDLDALIARSKDVDAAPARTASPTSTPTTDESGRDVEDEV
jgi:excisionase family DNA binding protein